MCLKWATDTPLVTFLSNASRIQLYQQRSKELRILHGNIIIFLLSENGMIVRRILHLGEKNNIIRFFFQTCY
jgi:hypothetical protein